MDYNLEDYLKNQTIHISKMEGRNMISKEEKKVFAIYKKLEFLFHLSDIELALKILILIYLSDANYL